MYPLQLSTVWSLHYWEFPAINWNIVHFIIRKSWRCFSTLSFSAAAFVKPWYWQLNLKKQPTILYTLLQKLHSQTTDSTDSCYFILIPYEHRLRTIPNSQRDIILLSHKMMQSGVPLCNICGEQLLLGENGERFVACHDCNYPICKPCFEHEINEGHSVCLNCATPYQGNLFMCTLYSFNTCLFLLNMLC